MKKLKPAIIVMMALLFAFSLVSTAIAKPPSHVPDHVKERFAQVQEKKKSHFSDLDQAKWAIPFITELTEKKIFAGYEDGTFRPNKPVTRAEALATAVRLMGLDDEAAKVDPNTTLHFKDAKQIDKRFAWAKGSIVVALQNGLFEPSEDKFEPQKPASRVWVASLMVRALGLEEEALARMTEIPNFKDAKAIPAGSIGYVNVAVDEGIVSGYTDNTFKPNKNVTRAEIAVLLAKTGERIEEDQARVVGKIRAIEFDGKTAGDGVDRNTNGTITVDTYTGDRQQYNISSELRVHYKDEYFLASQLRVGDIVDLIVEDQVVKSAALLLPEHVNEQVAAVQKFVVELEKDDDDQYKLYYYNKRGDVIAKVERKTDSGKNKVEGNEAQKLIESLLNNLALTPEMDKKEIENKIFDVLELDALNYDEIEIEIHFANGKKIEIEIERDDRSNRDKKDNKQNSSVKSFELELEFKKDGKLEVEYKADGKAKVEFKNGKTKFELKTDKANEWIDEHIELPKNKNDVDREGLVNAILTSLNQSASDLKEIEIEIKFNNGQKYEWEWEADDR